MSVWLQNSSFSNSARYFFLPLSSFCDNQVRLSSDESPSCTIRSVAGSAQTQREDRLWPTLAKIGVQSSCFFFFQKKKKNKHLSGPRRKPRRLPRRVGPRRMGGPKFSLFFFPLPPPFVRFVSLGVFSLSFGGFEGSRNSKTPAKINEKTPRERQKQRNFAVRRRRGPASGGLAQGWSKPTTTTTKTQQKRQTQTSGAPKVGAPKGRSSHPFIRFMVWVCGVWGSGL